MSVGSMVEYLVVEKVCPLAVTRVVRKALRLVAKKEG